jgi:hypothetical protein
MHFYFLSLILFCETLYKHLRCKHLLGKFQSFLFILRAVFPLGVNEHLCMSSTYAYFELVFIVCMLNS